MSTQPSSRFRPSTFGTSRRLVRYIFLGGALSLILSAVFLNALPSAAPNISAFDVMIVLHGGRNLFPEFARRDACAFGQRRELCPYHIGVDRGLSDPGAVAAIAARHHILAPDQLGIA